MKLLALLCLVGLAAASTAIGGSGSSWRLPPGTEYVFEYRGRLLNGLPELATHYSGLGIKCQVALQVESDGRTYGIALRQPEYVRVNERLESGKGREESDDETTGEGNNWRNLELPSFGSVPEEFTRTLESPVVFRMTETGEVKTITVSRDEPEWSVNFKKAIVLLFQTKFENTGRDLDENTIQNLSEEGKTYWKVKEQSIQGVCEVTYQLNKIPEYMIKDLPETIPKPEACSRNGDRNDDVKYYELVKTRDVSACEKRAGFNYYKPGFFRCPNGNCDGMWTRSSVTRYLACASNSGSGIVIQKIINEGELHVNLLGFNTEKFLSGTKQVLELIKYSRKSNEIATPSNPVTLESLMYEHKYKNLLIKGQKVFGNGHNQENDYDNDDDEDVLPREALLNGPMSKNPAEMISQIKKIMRELITEDFHKVEDLSEKQVAMKGLTMSRAFSVMDKSTIENLYRELKSEFSGDEEKETIFKNVFFDTVLMGGSVSNMLFIKEKIQSGEISDLQASAIFTLLPHYVLVPTRNLMENLFELVKSVSGKPMVYHHAILGYSSLLERACVADNRKSSYPTSVYGEFCHPDSHIIVEKWLPYLQSELHKSSGSEKASSRKHVIIVALGLLGHKNAIPMLMPYVEKTEESSSKLTRYLAIYALGDCGGKYPNLVVPVVTSVFSNPAENTEMRISAFNVLLKLNPPMSVFHKIAASTWYERDTEVLEVVNTALHTLSYQEEMESPKTTVTSIQKKAWIVYPLIKKTGGRVPSSGTVFSSDYLKELNAGYKTVSSWMASKDSIIPTDFFRKVVYYLDRYEFTPYEFGLRLRGLDNIIEKIVEMVDNDDSQDIDDEDNSEDDSGYKHVKNIRKSLRGIAKQTQEQLSGEWRKVIEKLRVEPRKGDRTEGLDASIYANIFEYTPIFASFESTTEHLLREKVVPLLKNPTSVLRSVCGKNRINHQRMLDLSPTEFIVPSDMGFPMIVEVHMPTTFSIQGEIDVKCDLSSPSVDLKVKALYSSQYTGWVGTLCPFTNDFVVTGVDEHTVINIPAEFSLNVNVPEHKLTYKIKPFTSLSRPIDIFHFHVRPYTVAKKYFDLTPFTLSRDVKFIESDSPSKKMTHEFGEYFGLKLKSMIETESHYTDMRSVIDRLRMFNYNPMNMLRFGWASTALTERVTPSIRRHAYKLQYDPSYNTKEIAFTLKYGYATKEESKPLKYQQVQLDNEDSNEDSNDDYTPYEIELQSIDEEQLQARPHPQRKQRIQRHQRQTGIESGKFLTIDYTMNVVGSRPRTVSYSLNMAAGSSSDSSSDAKQKWSVHIESESGEKKFCMDGEVISPNVPVWNIEQLRSSDINYRYKNTIGFGRSCEESTIKVYGNSKVSQKQKRFSEESPAAKQLKKQLEKNTPLAELSQLAEKVRQEASRLDEVVYTVEYENVPSCVVYYTDRSVEYLKALWWPYLVHSEKNVMGSIQKRINEQEAFQSGRHSEKMTWSIFFHPERNTVDVTLVRPASHEKNIIFKEVRVPYPLTYVLPYPASMPVVSIVSQAVTGDNLYPVCRLSGRWLSTYDNRSVNVDLDDCFHLLTADCSEKKRFGVLVRDLEENSSGDSDDTPKEIKIYLGKKTLLLTPSDRHSKYNSELEITVDGSRINLRKGSEETIEDNRGKKIAEIIKSEDGVVILKSKLVIVKFDGRKLKVHTTPLLKNKMCGLCGDLNGQEKADLRGPKKCIFSQPELLVASYRVPSPVSNGKKCDSLPAEVEQKLRREQERCAGYEEIPTKVTQSLENLSGKCTRHEHEIIERRDEYCFSRIPVTECGPMCKPESSNDVVRKSVSFTCMRKGRLADHYVEKIRKGLVLPELEQQPEKFNVELPLPRSCKPINKLA